LLITKKNKWKVKEKSKRSGLKETIGTNRTAAQSPFFLQILIRLFFLTETLFFFLFFFALSFDSVFFQNLFTNSILLSIRVAQNDKQSVGADY